MKKFHYISKKDFPEQGTKVLGFIHHPSLPFVYAEVVFFMQNKWYINMPWEEIQPIIGIFAWKEISYPKVK